MKFAKILFWIAGIWGMLLLTPLYFIFDLIGRQDPPPITHPAFYYGFVGSGLAFQFVFFVIATDPGRFRPMMIPAVLEKFSYGTALIVLFLQHRLHPADFTFGCIDLLFGILFLFAFFLHSNHAQPVATCINRFNPADPVNTAANSFILSRTLTIGYTGALCAQKGGASRAHPDYYVASLPATFCGRSERIAENTLF